MTLPKGEGRLKMKRNRLHSAPIILSLSHARLQSQSESRLVAGSEIGKSNGDENHHPSSSNCAGGGTNPLMSTSSSSSSSSPASSLPTSIATTESAGHGHHPEAYTLVKEDSGITDRIYQQVLASQNSEQDTNHLELFSATAKGTNLPPSLSTSSAQPTATPPATSSVEKMSLASRSGKKLVSPRKKPTASKNTNRVTVPDQPTAPSPYKQRLDAIISRRATNDYLERQASRTASSMEPGSWLICTPPWPHCQEELAAQYAQHLQNAHIRELAREPQQFQHASDLRERDQNQSMHDGVQRLESIPCNAFQLERLADPSSSQTQGHEGITSSQADDSPTDSRVHECQPTPASGSAEISSTPAKKNKNQSRAKRIKKRRNKHRAAQAKDAHLQDSDVNAEPSVVGQASESSSRSRSRCSSVSVGPASRHVTRASSIGDDLPLTSANFNEMTTRTPEDKHNTGFSPSREPVRLSLKLPPTNIIAPDRETIRPSRHLPHQEIASGTRRPASHARLPSSSAASFTERLTAGITHSRSASRPLGHCATDRQVQSSSANLGFLMGADGAPVVRDPASTSEGAPSADFEGRHRKAPSTSRAQKTKQRSKAAKEKASASQQTQQIAEIVSAAERGELVISSPKKIGSIRDGKSVRSAISIALLSATDALKASTSDPRGHKQGPANYSRESFEGCPSKADTEESFESAKSGLLSSSIEYATAVPADSPGSPRRSWSPPSPVSDTPRRPDDETMPESVKTIKQVHKSSGGAAYREQAALCHSRTEETTPEDSLSRLVTGALGVVPSRREAQAALFRRIDQLQTPLASSPAKSRSALESAYMEEVLDRADLSQGLLDSDLYSRLPTLLDDMTDRVDEALALHRAKLEDTIFRTESWRRDTEDAKAASNGGHLTPSDSSVWWSSPDASSTKSSTDDAKIKGSWDEPYDPSPDPFIVRSVEARLPRRVVKAMSELFKANASFARCMKRRTAELETADMDLANPNHRAAFIDQVEGMPTFEHVHSRTSIARKIRLASLSRFDIEDRERISHRPPPSQQSSPLKRTVSAAAYLETNALAARVGQTATVSSGTAAHVGPSLHCHEHVAYEPQGLQPTQRQREDSFGLAMVDYQERDGPCQSSAFSNIGPPTPTESFSDSNEQQHESLFPTAVDSRCWSPFSEDEADDQDVEREFEPTDVPDSQWMESLASLHSNEARSIVGFFEQGQRFWEMCREFWGNRPQEHAAEGTGESFRQSQRTQSHGHQDNWDDAAISIEAHSYCQAKDDSYTGPAALAETSTATECHGPVSTMLPPEIATMTTPMQHFIFRRQPRSSPASGSLNGIAGMDAKNFLRAVKQQLGQGCSQPLSPPKPKFASPQSKPSDEADAYRVSRAIQILPQKVSPGQKEREATQLRLVQEAYDAYCQKGAQQAQAVATGWHGGTKPGKSNTRSYRRPALPTASLREGKVSLQPGATGAVETHAHRLDAAHDVQGAQKPSNAMHGANRNGHQQLAMQAGPLDFAPYGMVANIADPRSYNEQVVQQAAQHLCGQRGVPLFSGSFTSPRNIRVAPQAAAEFFPHPSIPGGDDWDLAGSGDEPVQYDQHYAAWLSSVRGPPDTSGEALIKTDVISREAYLNDCIDYTHATVAGAGGQLSTTAGHWAACAPILTPMYESFGTWDEPVSPHSGPTRRSNNGTVDESVRAQYGSSDAQYQHSLRPSGQRSRQLESSPSRSERRYQQQDHFEREYRVGIQNGPSDPGASR